MHRFIFVVPSLVVNPHPVSYLPVSRFISVLHMRILYMLNTTDGVLTAPVRPVHGYSYIHVIALWAVTQQVVCSSR